MPASHLNSAVSDRSDHFGRAWYEASFQDFLASSDDAVIGRLASRSEFDIQLPQREAWIQELSVLRATLPGLTGQILLEFSIPRPSAGRRAFPAFSRMSRALGAG